MWTAFPLFGNTLLLCIMVAASFSFAVALKAGADAKLRTLLAARYSAYGTVALIGVTVLCLAYAFVSHDFRLRYVAHYSDRGMSTPYLFTALWGGQDGSLLWWLFLLSLYIGVTIWWLGKKYLALQPYILATCMAVVVFFCVLMAFAANPFSTSVAGARPDGEGLNPLLQNFYMIIHPPSLYIGFVGCTIPFAFCVAALVTGRLDTEWIQASRKFTLFSWMFLGIGNTLGMLWAYEELGWGGYWAWDPVENAAFMPFLTASAFVHSVMIQERRGLLKVWNVFLVCLTFLMTIFGTFLTRSGMISSVHSFAQSSIGTYFVWFMLFVAIVCFTLVFYRWPELRDYPPTTQLRKAAIVTGWSAILLGGPFAGWLSSIIGSPIITFTIIEGVVAFVVLEFVLKRMVKGLSLISVRPEIESIWSREFTFLLNNWSLLGFMLFVLVATTFPLVSDALWKEKVTVGPPYYNSWVQPIGLVIYFLMGVGTIFGWKKTSSSALSRMFRAPIAFTLLVAVVHLSLGSRLGYPAFVFTDPIYSGALGKGLRAFNGITPFLGVSLSAFNAAVIVQEFVLLFRARKNSGAEATPAWLYMAGFFPGFVHTMVNLPTASRRRYGGYIVHFGIVLAFIGFTGKSWTIDKETSLAPGQSIDIDRFHVVYEGSHMEVDNSARKIFADLNVTVNGGKASRLAPAKFIYKKMPESPTTEVSMLHTWRDDLYAVVGQVNPETKVASFQLHLNPLVGWIWLGCLVLIFGSFICMWPEPIAEESRVWRFARGLSATAASASLGILLAVMPTHAYAQNASSLHAAPVKIQNANERDIFGALRCMCGTCARDLLSTCGCSEADEMREKLRAKIALGETKDKIIADYAAEHGSEALAIPPNTGALRSIYAVPLVAIGGGGVGLFFLLRSWRSRTQNAAANSTPAPTQKSADDYDARLDEELRDLDE